MFTLTLVTPEKKIVSGQEIEEVFVPGFRGELNILPGHSPLMTTLSTGVLKYRLKGQTEMQFVAVSWGYAQVGAEGVNILAETAERPFELDTGRIDRAMKDAEQHLTQTLSTEDIDKYQNKLARSRARKDVAGHSSGTNEHH
jgi:F-type H+-transporting ATPase subunit epsilon